MTDAATTARMRAQRTAGTGPEAAVARELRRLRRAYAEQWPVPGMPRRTIDLALRRARVAVFVDGCFWHGCPDHWRGTRTRSEWWERKVSRNAERDRETTAHLRRLGWTVVRAWEHEDPARVAARASSAARRRLARAAT